MRYTVPFNDLGAVYRRLRPVIDEALGRVAASGWYVGGPEVDAFEKAFAAYAGVGHAIGVGNGTDAIALALRAVGVKRGDQVVVPALSAYPTAVGVLQAEATPSFVDVDASGLIDVAAVEQALTPSVKAVVCVHLYGNCANAGALAALCASRNLPLVEDCAQAHGCARDGRRAGTFGRAAAWSFYPTKNLGALGDAGAVTCDDDATASTLRRLRNYGQRDRYEHVERGFNSRLDPLQAAVLAAKLPNLESDNARRRAIGERYDRAFSGLDQVRPVPVPAGVVPNRHLYAVLLPDTDARTKFSAFLAERGVETLIHYPIPMPDQAASESAWAAGRALPMARALCAKVVSLPLYPDLADEQVDRVIEAVRAFATQGRK
jgi:dTDP-4-amino-4,6-dideoxygalactose transaminase